MQRHADAAPHPHAQVVHLERLPDHGDQPRCELVHGGAVGQRGEDHELVTTEAGDEVLHPQARPDAVRHLAEQRVADVVPEVVVHGLEVVEVDEQAPEHLVTPVGRRDHRLEALLEGGAVGDVGERVVRRRVGEAGRVGHLVGDVVDLGQHVTGLVVLVAHEGHRHLRPEERAVRSVVLGPQVELVATVGRPRLDHRPELLDRLGAGHLGDVLTDQLVLGGIQQRAQRAVDPDDGAVELDDGHADRGGVEGDAGQLVHRVELPFRLQPQGLVPAPDGEVDGARREHVHAVHGGELEGVGVAALLTEDRVRRQHPDHAVLDQHRDGGRREGQPVVIEGEQPEDHEEVEVRLHRAAGQVHEHRRRHHQADRDGHGPGPLGEATPERQGGEHTDRRDVDRHVVRAAAPRPGRCPRGRPRGPAGPRAARPPGPRATRGRSPSLAGVI